MAENLKTTTYNDGTSIALGENDTDWENNTTGAYCWYDNDQATYADTYDAFYNWHAVNTGNLCPDGWHMPTDEEWKTLEMHLGMSQAEAMKRVGEAPAKGASWLAMLHYGATELWKTIVNLAAVALQPFKGSYRSTNGVIEPAKTITSSKKPPWKRSFRAKSPMQSKLIYIAEKK